MWATFQKEVRPYRETNEFDFVSLSGTELYFCWYDRQNFLSYGGDRINRILLGITDRIIILFGMSDRIFCHIGMTE